MRALSAAARPGAAAPLPRLRRRRVSPRAASSGHHEWLPAAARRCALSLALAAQLASPLDAAAALLAPQAQQEQLDTAMSGGERSFRRASRAEAEAKRSLFTADAYAGMTSLAAYAELVETQRGAEAAPGCEACAGERARLERAWQTVANEAYGGNGFTQASWSKELRAALARAGGVLRNGAETSAAVQTMVEQLHDKYSAYLSPPAWRAALGRPLPAERAYTAAQATGVGLTLGGARRGGWRVAAPLAGSPAEEAGVAPGDVLQAVDDVAVAGMSADDVAALLRGPEGSVCSVTLASAASGQRRELSLQRRSLLLPPVPPPELLPLPGPRGGAALYVRVRYFSSEASADLARALRYGVAFGARSFVVDVRNNPGGVLEEAVASAALLAPCGSRLAQTRRADDAPPDVRYVACELPAGQFTAPLRAPIVPPDAAVSVLINAGSASAAEAFAAAARDARQARLLGTRSFGKAAVQFFFPLADGGGLRLTVRKWLTPAKGADVSRAPRGLRPDAACADQPRAPGDAAADACVMQALRG